MKSVYIILIGLCLGHFGFSQQRATTLDKCLEAVTENYPATDKLTLIEQINELNLEKLNTEYLPQFDVTGQTTYQSDVTGLGSTGGMGAPVIEPLSKYQYKANLNLDQKLYDGGITSIKKDLQRLTSQIDSKQVEVTLESIKDQIVSYYFNALLADRNLIILESSEKLVRTNLEQLRSQFRNGVAMESDVNTLQVELLQLDQQRVSLEEGRKLSIRLISILSGLDIDEITVLEDPGQLSLYPDEFDKRPEFELLVLQKDQIEVQEKLTTRDIVPSVSAFGQAGYGRPGLNQLKNEFADYFLGGFKLSWDISSFYTNRKDHELGKLNRAIVDEDTAVLQNQFENDYAQSVSNLEEAQKLFDRDKEIVRLRRSVTKAASSELKNGIITATDYLTEFNNELESRQDQALHRIQREQAKYTIKLLTGN